MSETTYLPEVRCEVREGGLFPDGVSAHIVDAENRSQFVQVTKGLINSVDGVPYLPIGFVEIDRRRRRVLIELPSEADSGANRMWVPFEALRRESARESEAFA